MNKPAAAAQESAFEIRFGQVGLAQMRIRSTDAAAVQAQLTARVAAAPALFERAALCLDLSPLDHDVSADELRAVLGAIRNTGMLPVGARARHDDDRSSGARARPARPDPVPRATELRRGRRRREIGACAG